MEWTKDQCLTLIDNFRQRPVLWDPHLNQYKNRHKKKDSWQELGDYFGLSGLEVEKKMRYLMSHFARELRKEKESAKSGAGIDEIYRSKWFAYNHMLFLKDRRNTMPTVDNEASDGEIGTDEDIGIGQEVRIEEADIKIEIPEASPLYSEEHSLSPVVAEPAPKKARSIGSPSSREHKPLKQTCSILGSSRSIPPIAIAWGEKLEALESQQRLFAEKAINDVLFEAALGNLSRYSVKINE